MEKSDEDQNSTPCTDSSMISIRMTVDVQPGSETSNQLVMKTAEKISEAGWNSAQKVPKIRPSSFIQKKPKIKNFSVKPDTSDDDERKMIKCRFCDKKFERQVQLGGHASKAHPGKSSHYARKMEIFKKRTHERETRVKACEWFLKKTGLSPNQHRALITRIKKDMLASIAPTLPKHIEQKIAKKIKNEQSSSA